MTSWIPTIARAIPALALAIVVTFTADHSAPLGYVTFGLFAVITGLIVGGFALRFSGVESRVQVGQGALTLVAGIVALFSTGAGLPFFVFLLTAWAAITGFLELYLGLRGRRTHRAARDYVFVGVLTAALAIVVLLVPPGFVQSFTGPDEVVRQLTASVIVVGALGAYWAILGVYLVIAGLSLKWATDPVASTAPVVASDS